jgi:hypothetical protein
MKRSLGQKLFMVIFVTFERFVKIPVVLFLMWKKSKINMYAYIPSYTDTVVSVRTYTVEIVFIRPVDYQTTS